LGFRISAQPRSQVAPIFCSDVSRRYYKPQMSRA
jgi:hypothetical protein